MSNIPLISTKPEQSPLSSDGQQFHQNQQSQQSPLNSDGPTIPPMSTKQTITSKQWWSNYSTNVNKTNNHV